VPRVRRPLLALIILIVALAIVYSVRALQSDGGHQPAQAPTVSTSATP
jgi:hypothetical protein